MTTTHTATPVGGRERIHSLDVIRGVALLGILLMNILSFGTPSAYSDPTVSGGDTGANLWTWITTEMLIEGTQRGLFSILFGAGFIVLTSRLEAAGRTDVADVYYRRSLWLIAFGLVDAYLLLWFGDILYFYGVIALMLYPLRRLAPKVMLAVAAAALVAGAIWSLGELRVTLNTWERAQAAQATLVAGRQPSEQQQADLDAWKSIEEKKPNARAIQRDIEAHHGSYLKLLAFNAPLVAQMESWYLYRLFFDIFSMMLIGMALFKMGVLTLKQPPRLYWTMVLIGYPVGLAVNYHELRTILDGNFSVLSFTHAHWTYDFGRFAMTLGHLGAVLLFCRSGWLRGLQRALAAVGRMALSNYVSHSIICAVVFSGFGFGLYGKLERHQLYYVVLSIWVFQLILSPIWLKHFRFGPLEWLWRSLTYVERQPMRRKPAADGTPVSVS